MDITNYLPHINWEWFAHPYNITVPTWFIVIMIILAVKGLVK